MVEIDKSYRLNRIDMADPRHLSRAGGMPA
jgi:hypothetical protein